MNVVRLRHLWLPLSFLALLGLPSCGGGGEEEEAQGTSPVSDPSGEAVEEAEPEIIPGANGYVSESREKPPTRLFKAVDGLNAELVGYILEDGEDPNATLDDGLAPIHVATGKGSLEIVELLVGKGANVNAPQAAGATPLHIAVSTGNHELAKFLLENDADPNIGARGGVTPLHNLAFAKGMNDEQLVAMGQLLLDNGAEINALTTVNSTPLMVACSLRVKPMVELLLSKGADTEIEGDRMNRALHIATYQEDLAICTLLLENGADVNAKNEDKASAIAIAASLENAELVQYFQANGAQ